MCSIQKILESTKPVVAAVVSAFIPLTVFAAPQVPTPFPTATPAVVCTLGLPSLPGLDVAEDAVNCGAAVINGVNEIRKWNNDCEREQAVKDCKARNECKSLPPCSSRTYPPRLPDGSWNPHCKEGCEKNCEEDPYWTEMCDAQRACAGCLLSGAQSDNLNSSNYSADTFATNSSQSSCPLSSGTGCADLEKCVRCKLFPNTTPGCNGTPTPAPAAE
ncbi:MAG: hypothetical protein J5J00_11945 [Deltaproteobacteria bacterium]|nr:hypothetical protein [Deltaproteobacteria bacterium]